MNNFSSDIQENEKTCKNMHGSQAKHSNIKVNNAISSVQKVLCELGNQTLLNIFANNFYIAFLHHKLESIE